MPPAQTKPQGLDPDVVNLTKAIRQTESGGNFTAKGKSGEYGAYQYTEPTWNADSKAAGINVPLTQATPEQQNQVAYTKVAALKNQGNNVGQVASIWNSGKPDAYLDPSYKGTNNYGAGYDVPAYAKSVASAYQTIKSGGQVGLDPNNPSSVGSQVDVQPESPSLGGFGMNVLKSGANLLGGVGDALLHPIETVQNLGGAAVGGLQELGGQSNDNTAKFDSLKDYFGQRYGGISNLEHTLYSDPVGFLADLSTALGAGAGVAGAVGKIGELTTAADAARASSLAGETGLRTMAGDIASGNGLTRTARGLSSALGKASDITNPLGPVASGITALSKPLSKAATFGIGKAMGVGEDTTRIVQDNKAAFTTEAINNANFTRAQVAKEVEQAFQQREAEFSDTGAAYQPLKESTVPVKVAANFLEEQLRNEAGVEVVDGQIQASAGSKIRATKDINALQQLFNTFKPAFQKGQLTAQEFFNLRDDLRNVAKYDREFTASKPVEHVAAAIRSKFNEIYRKDIPNLEKIDSEYGAQAEELQTLRKGFFDKDGNLLETAVNKIANATGKGKDQLLERLEALKPGITKKIQVQKALEDIQAATKPRVGTYTESALKAGGILAGISTGNVGLIAGSVALAIIGDPRIAVPLLKAFDFDSRLVGEVSARLAKYVTLGTVTNQATPQPQSPQDTVSETPIVSPKSDSSQDSITQTPGYQEARKAGYTDEEIRTFLAQK